MEVIIKGDGTNNRKVLNFAQLKSIAVKDMQTLTRFYSHERNMGSNSTNSTDISSDHFGLRQENTTRKTDKNDRLNMTDYKYDCSRSYLRSNHEIYKSKLNMTG